MNSSFGDGTGSRMKTPWEESDVLREDIGRGRGHFVVPRYMLFDPRVQRNDMRDCERVLGPVRLHLGREFHDLAVDTGQLILQGLDEVVELILDQCNRLGIQSVRIGTVILPYSLFRVITKSEPCDNATTSEEEEADRSDDANPAGPFTGHVEGSPVVR